MLLLAETSKRDVKYLLAPQNYTGLYNKIKSIMPQHYSFFAKPVVKVNSTNWFFESTQNYKKSDVQSYESISEEQKDLVSDIIEDLKPELLKILKKEPEFKGIADSFFEITSKKDIKVIVTEIDPIVILTHWGCRPSTASSDSDPVSTVVKRPKPNRTNVVIDVKYSDGSIASEKTFYFDYNKLNKKSKTNSEGIRDLGKFKFDSKIDVYDILENEKLFIHSFTVQQNNEYKVVFPLFADAKVKVINQKKQIIPDTQLIINYEGDSFEKNSGNFGIFDLEQLEVGKEIRISEKDKPENSKIYKVEKDKNTFVFEILQPFYENAIIKVINQFDEIVPNTTLLLEYEGKDKERAEREHSSDENGLINLNEILLGSQIKATEQANTTNIQNYSFTEEENEFIFKIEVAVPKFVKIRLVERPIFLLFWKKEKPLANITIDFAYNGENKQAITNEEGICSLPEGSFVNNEKVKTVIHIPKETKKDKEKKEKKTNKENEQK